MEVPTAPAGAVVRATPDHAVAVTDLLASRPSRLDGGSAAALSIAASMATNADGSVAKAVVVVGGRDAASLALVGAPLAHGGSLLLADGDRVGPALLGELRRVLTGAGQVVVLADTPGRAARALQDLEGAGMVARSLTGTSPQTTSVAVADEVRRLGGADDVIVASLDPVGAPAWEWNAAGAGWAARHRIPVLLSNRLRVDPSVVAFLRAAHPPTTWLLGDFDALADVVERQLTRTQRLDADAIGLGRMVAEGPRAAERDAAILVNGDGPLGWAATAVAAWLSGTVEGGPVLLVDRDTVPLATGAVVAACGPSGPRSILTVGGLSLVGHSVTRSIAAARRAAGCTGGDAAYDFVRLNRDGQPVVQQPCQPIRFVLNTAGAPAGARDVIVAALAEASGATGLRLELVGDTAERLTDPTADRSHRDASTGGWKPVLINWPQRWPAGDPAWGYGGGARVTFPDGTETYVSGVVSLNRSIPNREALSSVVLHEIGHVLGLAHVPDRDQLLYAFVDPSLHSYQSGDLAGLAVIGMTGACAEPTHAGDTEPLPGIVTDLEVRR